MFILLPFRLVDAHGRTGPVNNASWNRSWMSWPFLSYGTVHFRAGTVPLSHVPTKSAISSNSRDSAMPMLADIILIIHLFFVLFVVCGLPAVWIGAWMRANFARDFRFRLAHLAAILFVAGESLVGMVCPLTWMEDALRGTHTESGFIQRGLHRILFYDFPDGVFTTIYVLFALLVAATYKLVPPHPRRT